MAAARRTVEGVIGSGVGADELVGHSVPNLATMPRARCEYPGATVSHETQKVPLTVTHSITCAVNTEVKTRGLFFSELSLLSYHGLSHWILFSP